MENNGSNNLPENAYRELRPGEVYMPVMPAHAQFPEITVWSVVWGLIMAVLFTAAVAYSSLKIGQAMEAAIPISILAVGIATAFGKKKTLGQNVIIQSIGASSGVIVAGAAFTIPALYILKLDVSFWQIFFSSLTGGAIGILFLIPFRKYFVKEMHGKFPFPEATATTEILITGEKGGKQAAILVVSGLIGGVYDFMFSSLHLWKEVFTSRVLPYGNYIAEKGKILFQMNVSAMIFGFGYLIGLRYSLIIALGSILSWFVLVPLINQIGLIAVAGHGAGFFSTMGAEDIFFTYVRPIGIGAIAMAGIIGILKSSKVIGSAFSLAFGGIFGAKKHAAPADERTQRDIKMPIVIMLILLTLIGVFAFVVLGVHVTLTQALVSLLIILIISFLFTTVAANAIAIVGSNPVSGMTLMTLILSSFILVQAGLTGSQGIVSALIIGGIVCTALSMAGGFITDLKIGYWLGSTPVKQESFKFLGVIVSAATVGLVIFILNDAYGFTKTVNYTQQEYNRFVQTYPAAKPVIEPIEKHKNGNIAIELDDINKVQTKLDKPAFDALVNNAKSSLEAPQANAMAAVIQPLMSPNAQVNWMLYLIGVIIAVIMNWLEISPLAFALGMYLPLHLNTPLVVGGLIAHFVSKGKGGEKLAAARTQRGTLIASGFMAGASIFGVIGALLLFFNFIDKDMNSAWLKNPNSEILGFVMFTLLVIYFIWETYRAKVED